MRKLTGYIGAMIIVFALMGSVLAGYALNINGNSAVVNEYEHVTDVSGLYNYSEEKSYIDYNPASNYINYSQTVQNDDPPYFISYKMWDGNHTLTYNSNTITLDGVVQNSIDFTASNFNIFVSDKILAYCYYGLSYCGIWIENDSVAVFSNNFTLTKSGSTVTLSGINLNTGTAFTTTSKTVRFALSYSSNADYDYYNVRIANIAQPPDVLPAYYGINPENKIYSSGSSTAYGAILTANDKIYDFSSNNSTEYNLYNPVMVASNVYYSSDVIYDHLNAGYTCTELYIPKTQFGILGINYTQSNRVNNYPAEYDYNTNITTQTSSINLNAMSATNVFTSSYGWKISDGTGTKPTNYPVQGAYFSNGGSFVLKSGVKEYLLSDILSTVTIPNGTESIRIDMTSIDWSSNNIDWKFLSVNVPVSTNIEPNGYVYTRASMPYDPDLIEIFPGRNLISGVGYNPTDDSRYGIYYPDTGQVDIFRAKDGSKLYTSTASATVIRFVSTSTTTGTYEYNYTGYEYNADPFNGSATTTFNLLSRNAPTINLTFNVSGVITDTHYMDITKGVSIKDTNTGDTTWNNQYENNRIQLLFRAENNNVSYHNEFTIAGNDIVIDYDGGRYYVTLNSGEPVDIGVWRNIVLDIDLSTQSLNAIPVRNFHSYTNVDLVNTEIRIGSLTNNGNTNIIWKPTTNSFTFGVYSTSVFMDTYGLVMSNPVMDITDYFTDLNNFYELKLYNFAIYGDSITVNGETYQVEGNRLIVGNDSMMIKDLSVIYANGHAYLEDNHISVDIGEITDNIISMTGAWYFQTELLRGYTAQKMIYEWDWEGFIFDNTQFCIFYIGLAVAALLIARKFCQLSIIDYSIFIVSIIIALGVQVIA